MEILRNQGANICYSDPHVPIFPKMRAHSFDMTSIGLTEEKIAATDCVLVATDHDCFDYKLVAENADLIVDTRGVYSNSQPNVIKA